MARKWTPQERLEHTAAIVALFDADFSELQIARKRGISTASVSRALERAGRKTAKRVRRATYDLDERAARDARVRSMYAEGMSLGAIAAETGLAKSSVHVIVKEDPQTELRPPGAHPRHTSPTARACSSCGRIFTPDRRYRNRVYCSHGCEKEARRSIKAAALAEAQLCSIEATRARLGVGERHVLRLIRDRRLSAVRVPMPRGYEAVWGVPAAEIEKYERDMMRRVKAGDAPQQAHWLDPDAALQHKRALGAIRRRARELERTEAEAEDVERRLLQERWKRTNRRRAGRPPAPPSSHHLGWRDAVESLYAELVDEWNRNQALGINLDDPRPTENAAFEAVAEQDWRSHAERWPRDSWPASISDPDALSPELIHAAASRVRMAVKRLAAKSLQNP